MVGSIDGQATVTGHYEIASPDDQHRVRQLAEQAMAGGPDDAGLALGGSIDAGLAAKLVRSKTAVQAADWRGSLAVVFAMWGEQRRLLPRSADNPTGEDALITKLDQLQWLFDGTNIDWSLIAVDDGDPDDSASVAEQRAALHREEDRVTVLRLDQAIPTESGPLATLASVDDSRKGGAIALGASHAMANNADAVIITDADNSVDLGQVGLLLDQFVGGAGVVIGDRKHPESVLVKAEDRWGPGIVVLRHMQRMVGRALFDRGLRDTQAAFKLYGRPALESILAAPSTFGFSFDSDWLFASVAADQRIERVPFAFIDSFEESASITQGPMTTWESLLTGLVAAARAREADHDEEMAAVVDDFATVETLERVIELVPDELRGAGDAALGQRETMTPQQLRAWLASVAAE